jgi:hypothetical protein
MQLELFHIAESEISDAAKREEWKTIKEFPLYEASTFGRFRRKYDCKIVGGTVAHNGYLHIGFMKNGRQITKLSHRIIAETFLAKPSDKHEVVNHKDRNRSNNRVDNLEWSTRSHNSKHSKSK